MFTWFRAQAWRGAFFVLEAQEPLWFKVASWFVYSLWENIAHGCPPYERPQKA